MTIQYFEKLADIPGIEVYNSKLPVFATQEYANYLKEVKNYFIIWFYVVDNPDIQMILPFAVRTKYLFKIGMFLTSTIYLNENIDIETEREFLNSVVAIIKRKKFCDWIQQPPNWAIFNVVPSNSIYCEFGTYKLDLEKYDENELYARMDRNTRYEIRKAIKNKVVIKKGFEYLEDCMKIFSNAAVKGSLEYPLKEDIEKLLEFFSKNLELYVSYHNDIPQSCNICIYNKFSLYGLYAASFANPLYGANHLLFWELIKDMKMRGVKCFDFVGARIIPLPGSKQEKIQLFKRHLGGDLFKGYLWKMPISKFKYSLYNYLLRTQSMIIRKEFKGDIIDQERNN